MRTSSFYVFEKRIEFLDVALYGRSDIRELEEKYADFYNIRLSLSDLEALNTFHRVEGLIITGGIPTASGFEALYKCNQLSTIVLDYEETDSDEEGIDLSAFPNLSNVCTRSDLNIRNIEDALHDNKLRIQIANTYRGKKKILLADNMPLLPPRHTVFFSTEAESPAAALLMGILRSVEEMVDKAITPEQLSSQLNSIAIIPICMSERLLCEGFGKERTYVSLKQRKADIRLQIEYESFLAADKEKRLSICKECIFRAIGILEKKDSSLQGKWLRETVQSAFKNISEEREID